MHRLLRQIEVLHLSRPALRTLGSGMIVAIAAASFRLQPVRMLFARTDVNAPTSSAGAFVILALAAFVALQVVGVRNRVVAAAASLFLTAFYYSPPVGAPFYNTNWSRVAVLAALAAAPFVFAIRDLRSQKVPDHESGYLPTLDGWRTIAVALVIGDHLYGSAALTAPTFSFFHFRGQHGVTLFFGISGFLITWKLLCEYRDRGTISLTAFYRRRVFRILPASLLFLSVMCVLFPRITAYEWASCVLFYRNLTQGMPMSSVTSHFWSLSLEEQFYLALPALLALLSPKRMRLVAFAAAIACAGWRWYYLPWDPAKLPAMSMTFRTDLRVDGLLWGCMLAFAFCDERWRPWLVRATAGWRWWAGLAAYCLVLAKYAKYATMTESVLVVFLLAGTVLQPLGLAGRLLESAPMKFIGRMSYGIYLWQHPFCFVPRTHIHLGWIGEFPFNIAATFALAAVSFYAIEKPILRITRARGRKPGVNSEKPLPEMVKPAAVVYAS